MNEKALKKIESLDDLRRRKKKLAKKIAKKEKRFAQKYDFIQGFSSVEGFSSNIIELLGEKNEETYFQNFWNFNTYSRRFVFLSENKTRQQIAENCCRKQRERACRRRKYRKTIDHAEFWTYAILIFVETMPAKLAIFCIRFVPFFHTISADSCCFCFLHCINLGRNNSSRHCNNRIAKNHYKTGNKSA